MNGKKILKKRSYTKNHTVFYNNRFKIPINPQKQPKTAINIRLLRTDYLHVRANARAARRPPRAGFTEEF